MNINLPIDQTWTLFLDRDGVINKRLVGEYVKTPDEFELLPGVTDAIKRFSQQFGRIIVVTNQQGIGKGIMTESDLQLLHKHFIDELIKNGTNVDAIYFAPHLAGENHAMRKPNIGMALQAQKDFPEIELHKSIMIGDSHSDMQFGKNAGMYTVFVGHHQNEWSDYYADNLDEVRFTP